MASRKNVLFFLMDHPQAVEAAMPLLGTLRAGGFETTVVAYASQNVFPVAQLLACGANYLTISDQHLEGVPRLSRRQYARLCGDDLDFFQAHHHQYAVLGYPLTREHLFADSPYYQRFYGVAYRVESIVKACRPDFVIVHQGSEPISKIAYAKCRKLNVPTLLWETPFFPNKLLLDSCGMHFFQGQNRMDRDWPQVRRRPLSPTQRHRLRNYLEGWKANKVSKYSQQTDPNELRLLRRFLRSGKKVLFFPGQLRWDANVLTGLQTFESYDQILPFLCRELPPDWRIVHKIHPKDPSGDDSAVMSSENCLCVRNIGIHELIDASAAVFVHSSNVGLEALIYGKPVLCSGRPCYSAKGLTMDLGDRPELAPLLSRISQDSPNHDLRDKFLNYVIFSYLIDEGDVCALQQRFDEAESEGSSRTDLRAPFAVHYPGKCARYHTLLKEYNALADENFSHREVMQRLSDKGRREWAAPLEQACQETGAEALQSGERQVGASTDQIAPDHLLRYSFATELLRCIRRDPMRVLDFACGVGYGSFMLAHLQGASIMGVDCSDDAIAFAKSKWSRHNVEYRCASGGSLAGPPQSFDAVVSFETVEHMARDLGLLRKVWTLLRPGGVLILSVPHLEEYPMRNHPFHVEHYCASGIHNLLAELQDIDGICVLGQTDDAIVRQPSGRFLVAAAQRGSDRGVRAKLDDLLAGLLPFDTLSQQNQPKAHHYSARDLCVADPSVFVSSHIEFSEATRDRLGSPLISHGPCCPLRKGTYEIDLDLELESVGAGREPVRVHVTADCGHTGIASFPIRSWRRRVGLWRRWRPEQSPARFRETFSLERDVSQFEVVLHYNGPGTVKLHGWVLRSQDEVTRT